MEKEQKMLPKSIKIGECELDVASGIILDGNRSTKLGPKSVDILIYFAEHPGQLVSRDQLMDAVWPGVVITESQISKRILEIRNALGDNDEPRQCIETLTGRGFRLICTTEIVDSPPSDVGAQPVTAPAQNRRLVYAMFGLVLLMAGFLFSDRFLFTEQQAVTEALATAPSSQTSPVMRFTVPLSEDADLYLGGVAGSRFGLPRDNSLALSSDGNLLVYSAWEEGPDGLSSRLYLRRLDQIGASPIEGTEGASSPFFSPDNAWIGFFLDSTLQRVRLTGGIAETIVPESNNPYTGIFGASWGDDGTIVYPDLIPNTGTAVVYRVASNGGVGELIAAPNSSRNPFFAYVHPQLLPGSKVLLFTAAVISMDPEQAEIIAMDLHSGTQTSLLTNAMNPLYVAETGHLLFMRQGSLMAVGFDPDQLVIEGEPVIVEGDVMQAVGMPNYYWESGAAQLAVSSSGHMVYVRGGVFPLQTSTLMRVMREGEAEPFNSTALANFNFHPPRLSPEGDLLAFSDGQGRREDIYVYDFIRDITQPLNTGGFSSWLPTWSPDGESIAFSSDREDNITNIYRMPADGSDGQPERLAPSIWYQHMMSWSSEGVIAYLQGNDAQGRDIWILPPDGEPVLFFTSETDETYATFSPDGKWLAYTSIGGSRGSEVYIRPYPGPAPAVLVSGNRSAAPAWSRDGTQLYFQQSNAGLRRNVMMVVDIIEGRPSPARLLIDDWPYTLTNPSRNYDILEDSAFIAVEPDRGIFSSRESYRVDEIQVVLNFFEVLRQRAVD